MSDKLLQCGIIVSMDPEIGILNDAEILVRDGRIETVGDDVADAATDPESIDLTDCIVLPGLINGHAHLFQAGVRGVAGDYSLADYYHNIKVRLRPAYNPEDVYLGNLFGAFEQINAGVTTVFDWCHVINTPTHADSAIDGLIDAQIRAIFGYGDGVNLEITDPHPADARRIANERLPSDDGRVQLALSLRRPSQTSYALAKQDIEFARDLGVLASMHIGAAFYEDGADERIGRMNEDGLLGSDINFVHANDLSEATFDVLADTGVSVSITPEVEMQMGHGLPATGKALTSGTRFTLGSDVVSSIGSDMFTPMRIAMQTQRALDNQAAMAADETIEDLSVSLMDVLRSTTIEGARALGLDEHIGSITPGKKADITAIAGDHINTSPVRNPIATIVLHAEPANVKTVIIDGEVVKRGGQLVNEDATNRWDDFIHTSNDLLRRAEMDDHVYTG